MALGITFDCPIDNLPLIGTVQAGIKGDITRDVASHMHAEFRSASLRCANNHEWSLDGSLKLYRGSRTLPTRER